MRLLIASCFFLLACAAQAASDRHAYFISDLHFGAGRVSKDGPWNRHEDFRWNDALLAFLAHAKSESGNKADLVLVGDVFELWQSPFMECSRDPENPGCKKIDCAEDSEIGCSEVKALDRLKHVTAQHKDSLDALQAFAAEGSNTLAVVPGNHDAAILMPMLTRHLVNDVFKKGRVKLWTEGAWLSQDGAIYADHGHQLDDLNRFEGWPKPYQGADGSRFIRRPWGENLVQAFYNQYEEVMPVVDNLLDEKDGLDFAVKHASGKASAKAVGKFLRFFVLQQSLHQAMTGLGKEKEDKFDIGAVRAQRAEFFLDVLQPDPMLMKLAMEAKAAGALEFDASKLKPEEIEKICAAKAAMRKSGRPNVLECPLAAENLGAFAKGLIKSEDELISAYLETVFTDIAKPGKPLPSAYIFGHTHRAENARPVNVESRGVREVSVANTGAFQRVGTAAQLEAALDRRKEADHKFTAFDLTPEDLPECYTFVHVAPYTGKPNPVTMHFSKVGAAFKPDPGPCPR